MLAYTHVYFVNMYEHAHDIMAERIRILEARKAAFEASYVEQGITVEKVQEIWYDAMSWVMDIENTLAGLYEERNMLEHEEVRLLGDYQDEHDVLTPKLTELRERKQRNIVQTCTAQTESMPHELSFYQVCSDNIPALYESVDVAERRVATVASNGDFWQIFTFNDAMSVDIFDISLPALMYSELKLVALAMLSFDEYKKLFGASINEIQERKRYGSIIDKSLYINIREHLTLQAKVWFDRLTHPSSRPLIDMPDDIGFARMRCNNLFIGDVVSSQVYYDYLSVKSVRTDYALKLLDITKLDTARLSADIVYISNIGYVIDNAVDLAMHIAALDGCKVILSTNQTRVKKSKDPNFARLGCLDFIPGKRLDVSGGLAIKILAVDSQQPIEGDAILEVS